MTKFDNLLLSYSALTVLTHQIEVHNLAHLMHLSLVISEHGFILLITIPSQPFHWMHVLLKKYLFYLFTLSSTIQHFCYCLAIFYSSSFVNGTGRDKEKNFL